MNLKSFFAAIILLTGLSLQQCTIGCLRCNAQNQCLLCDVTNNFRLSGTGCQLNQVTNCLLPTQSGLCTTCLNQFYLDTNTRLCMAVSAAKLVSNCILYNSAQDCALCGPNFYVSNGRCVALTKTIPFCRLYSGDGVCSECQQDYVRSATDTACTALPKSTNCLFYTFLQCDTCNPGYINNPNLYFQNWSNNDYITNWYLHNIISPNNYWQKLEVCQKITVTNCEIASTFNTCTKCNANYYLLNGNCFAYPQPAIPNCAVYTSLTVCTGCAAGFFLENASSCKANVAIPNCTVYSGSAAATTCTACATGFYVNGNACTGRLAVIASCSTLTANLDTCDACSGGLILTSDKRKCLPTILNCATYETSTSSSTVLVCNLCVNGFYVTNTNGVTTCTQGTVANCLTYTVNANTCTVCQNKYYLDNLLCVLHADIPQCNAYSKTVRNVCADCNSGYYAFGYKKTCVTATLIAQCTAYDNAAKCTTCAAGFYLAADGLSCPALPTGFANCLTFSGTACTKCDGANGWILAVGFTNANCTQVPDYITKPCAKVADYTAGVSLKNDAVNFCDTNIDLCLNCGDFMRPVYLERFHSICVKTDDLKLYNGYNAVLNCKRYGNNGFADDLTIPGKNVVCQECADTYFLANYHTKAFASTSELTCVTTCDLSLNVIVPDNYLGFVNLCIGTGGANTDNTNPRFHVADTERNCARLYRFRFAQGIDPAATTFATIVKENINYSCFLPRPSTNTELPNYYLAIDPEANFYHGNLEGGPYNNPNKAGVYRPDQPHLSGANIDATRTYWDFGGALSNTVDATSVYPTIFNYKGLPPYLKAINIGAPSETLRFCDIVYKYSNVVNSRRLSSAWATNVDTEFLNKVAFTAERIICLRCRFGYQLSYVPKGVKADNPLFPTCVPMTDCVSATTVKGGLPTYLNMLFSCHVCNNPTSSAKLYPTVWIELDGATTTGNDLGIGNAAFIGWKLWNIYTSLTSVNPNNGFKCAPMPAKVIVTDVDAAADPLGYVVHCAAFAYVVALNTLTTVAGTLATSPANVEYPICVACDPNSYPEYGYANDLNASFSPITAAFFYDTNRKVPRWYVKKCHVSLNCDITLTNTFNGCTRCTPDNTVADVYYAFKNHYAHTCVKTRTPNCFAASGAAAVVDDRFECTFCKAGYFLNDNMNCEQLRIPHSANSATFNIHNSILELVDDSADNTVTFRYQALIKAGVSSFYGPSECNAGYHIFPPLKCTRTVCLWSSYIYNQTAANLPFATLEFINNCVGYKTNGACHKCADGYLPNADETSCVLVNDAQPNCLKAVTASTCSVCKDGFNILDNVCTANKIKNCQVHAASTTSLSCTTCMPTFYKAADSKSCHPGFVQNCVAYDDSVGLKCLTCNDGFTLVSYNVNAVAGTYCYPIAASLNCKTLLNTVGDGIDSGFIECGSCASTSAAAYKIESWTTTSTDVRPQTLCMPFTLVPDCLTYVEDALTVITNSYSCTSCSNNRWYSASNFTCNVRINVPSACTEFTKTADTCEKCSGNTFLSTDKKTCVAYPTGVKFCSIYTSATVCSLCNNGYYLSSNVCIISTVIANCLTYSANNVCAACQPNFFLASATSCVASIATNCLTASSTNTCTSCAPTLGLQKNAQGVTNCVNNLLLLKNCVLATQVEPFNCTLCEPTYFIDVNKTCTAVPRLIGNCAKYDSATTCELCTNGTVLNLTRTACDAVSNTDEIDKNCLSHKLSADPICTQCGFGLYFVNGVCTACASNTHSSGCMSCDPLNNAVCLVCRPNYHMNAQGSCVASSLIANNPTGGTTGQSGSSAVTQAVAASLAIATLYFDLLE